jgi:tetratricopeptide (TPR) repeat protein
MFKTPLVHMVVFCALLTPGIRGNWGADYLGIAAASPANEYYDNASFSTKADAMVSTVESFIEMQNFKEAETSALELTTSYPEYVKGWLLLGYCQSRTSSFAASNESYDRALSLGASEKTILTRKAYNFVRMGQIESAKSCYEKILEEDYQDPDALKQLGFIEGKIGNYEEASHYYRRILLNDPENAEVIQAIAEVEAKQGNTSEVKSLLEKNLELDPNNEDALSRLALVYMKEKNYMAAVDPLKKLVAVDPENVKAHRNLGAAYYALGDKSKACPEFQKVREMGGDIGDLYGPLAECYIEIGATSEAVIIIREGIERDSQTARLYCLWGNILEKSGRYDSAISKFSRAAKLQDEPWSSYASKQIARQSKLKRRDEIIKSQQGMQ